jgi:hypothetical protein
LTDLAVNNKEEEEEEEQTKDALGIDSSNSLLIWLIMIEGFFVLTIC